jgi:SAM-dependent methyltransferase
MGESTSSAPVGAAGDASWVESMPEIYDRYLGPVIFAPWARLVAAEVATLAPRRVLELAAGTGILTAALVSALPDAAITATDLNPAMVAFGSSRVDGASWRAADAEHLELPDDCFDAVACQFGVMFFPDRPAAFAEARRVLAPDGQIVFTTWDRVETSTFIAVLAESLPTVLGDDVPTFLTRVPHGYHDIEQIQADLAAGGLMAVRIRRHVPTETATSVADVARGFCYGTPLRFELERRGALDELAEVIGAEVSARLGTGPVVGELAGFLVTAQIA